MLNIRRTLSAFVLVAGLTVSAPNFAGAQATAVSTVSPSPKGIVGLGLLGAELGLFIPALFPATDWWPYVVFPAVGAIGGGIGGYFLEQGTATQPEISIAFLIAGIVLVVPTVVGTLALTQYRPDDGNEADAPDDATPVEDGTEAVEDSNSTEVSQDPEPEAAPAEAAPAAQPAPQSRLLEGGPGLIRFSGSTVLLGAPMIEARATYTTREVTALRLNQSYDVHVPVISGTF